MQSDLDLVIAGITITYNSRQYFRQNIYKHNVKCDIF